MMICTTVDIDTVDEISEAEAQPDDVPKVKVVDVGTVQT